MLKPALTKSRSKVSNSVFTREARASMSVNERASLETTMAPVPSSFSADSRPACERPVTRTRAPPSRSILAVASPMPLVPPIITTRFASYRPMRILLATLGLLCQFPTVWYDSRCDDPGQGVFELFIQNYIRVRDEHVASSAESSHRLL